MKGDDDTLYPLPSDLRHGIIAVVGVSALSFVTSCTLLVYLIGRLAFWLSRTAPQPSQSSMQTENVIGLPPRVEARYLPRAGETQRRVPNQFLVLVLNVLLADAFQSFASLLSVIWLVKDGIFSNSPECWVQGWFVSTGNVASAAFVATVAVHTYLTLVRGIAISSMVFYSAIILMWLFAILISVLGVIITNNGARAGGYFVRDGAWCWINTKYESLRLVLNFIWLDLFVAASTIFYILVFVHFQRKDKASRAADKAAAVAEEAFAGGAPAQETDAKTRVIFLLYPLVFFMCTAPLAISHMLDGAGVEVPMAYLIWAGVMISSNGWLHVLVFSATRGGILFAAPVDEQNVGLNTFKFTPMSDEYGYRVSIRGGAPMIPQPPARVGPFRMPSRRTKLATEVRHDRCESQTSLQGRDGSGLEGIQLETVTSIFVEETDSKTASIAPDETVGKRVEQNVDYCA
ncbi:integral membrane protein [Colletotrichum falcatum]|nr:integral membrane protein [Colletotrichum falcatum]